jgi:hypothetical protein
MGNSDRKVYICRASVDLATYQSKGSYGCAVDTVQQQFFGQDGISLRNYTTLLYETELVPADVPLRQNAILFPSEDCIDVFVYDMQDEMDFGWRSNRYYRGYRQELVKEYLGGKMQVPHTAHGKLHLYDIRVDGPKVIVVDESKTVKKRQPSAEQYAKIVKRNGWKPVIINPNPAASVFFNTGLDWEDPTPHRQRKRHPEDNDEYAFI